MKIQLISLAAILTAACSAAPGTEDSTSSSAEAVTTTGDVVGAFSGDSDAQFATIVLDPTTDANGHYIYFLEQHEELISCIIDKGCTVTHEREDGYFSATAIHLTLHPSTGPERVYSYTRKGSTFRLTRSGATGSYAELSSYCDTAADCAGEGLIRPECDSPTAGWECSATAHTCSFACVGAK